jgi:hypothetical protein
LNWPHHRGAKDAQNSRRVSYPRKVSHALTQHARRAWIAAMSELRQTEKNSVRAYVFRSSSNNGPWNSGTDCHSACNFGPRTDLILAVWPLTTAPRRLPRSISKASSSLSSTTICGRPNLERVEFVRASCTRSISLRRRKDRHISDAGASTRTLRMTNRQQPAQPKGFHFPWRQALSPFCLGRFHAHTIQL